MQQLHLSWREHCTHELELERKSLRKRARNPCQSVTCEICAKSLPRICQILIKDLPVFIKVWPNPYQRVCQFYSKDKSIAKICQILAIDLPDGCQKICQSSGQRAVRKRWLESDVSLPRNMCTSSCSLMALSLSLSLSLSPALSLNTHTHHVQCAHLHAAS